MTTEETAPDWLQDLIDFAKGVHATTAPKVGQANQAVRGVASSAHGTAGMFVRWVIVLVSLFPMVVAVPAFINYGLAKVVVPVITLVVMISTVGLLAFKWNKVVAGLIELGITVEVLSRIELRRLSSLSTLAGVAKDFGSSAFRWSMKVIGLELLIGLYFSLVPVANERVLVLIALMLMSAMMALSLGGKKGLARLTTVALVVITGIFFAGGNDEALALIESGVSSASSAQQTAPVQQAGLLIVHRSTEEDTCSLVEGQDYKEFPFEEAGDKCLIRVPLTTRHVRIDSVPSGTPYEICYRDERKGVDLGCYVDTPDSQNTIRLGQEGDFDNLDELSMTLVAIEPGTIIGIRIWR